MSDEGFLPPAPTGGHPADAVERAREIVQGAPATEEEVAWAAEVLADVE